MTKAPLIVVFFIALFIPHYSIAKIGSTPQDIFLEARSTFQNALKSEGNTRKEHMELAAELYKSIITEHGIHNGFLYYNIGNCYYHAGRLGKAILNWRRSERYIPSYPDLRENLRWALAERKDTVDEPQMFSIARNLFFWHFLLGLQIKIFISGIFFSLIFVLLTVRLYSYSSIITWGIIIFIFCGILFGGSAALEAYNLKYNKRAVVIAPVSVARKGPAESYDPAFEQPLHEGTELKVLSISGDWLRGELLNGKICWLRNDTIETAW